MITLVDEIKAKKILEEKKKRELTLNEIILLEANEINHLEIYNIEVKTRNCKNSANKQLTTEQILDSIETADDVICCYEERKDNIIKYLYIGNIKKDYDKYYIELEITAYRGQI